jgi:hypothetical protein
MNHQDLWGAVLQQAITDAHFAFCNPEADKVGATNLSPSDKIDAMNFITATYGPWKRARIDICHVSGIDPDGFYDRCAASLGKHGNLQDLIPPTTPLAPEERERRRRERRRREARMGAVA